MWPVRDNVLAGLNVQLRNKMYSDQGTYIRLSQIDIRFYIGINASRAHGNAPHVLICVSFTIFAYFF